jgi:hypothetical protein
MAQRKPALCPNVVAFAIMDLASMDRPDTEAVANEVDQDLIMILGPGNGMNFKQFLRKMMSRDYDTIFELSMKMLRDSDVSGPIGKSWSTEAARKRHKQLFERRLIDNPSATEDVELYRLEADFTTETSSAISSIHSSMKELSKVGITLQSVEAENVMLLGYTGSVGVGDDRPDVFVSFTESASACVQINDREGGNPVVIGPCVSCTDSSVDHCKSFKRYFASMIDLLIMSGIKYTELAIEFASQMNAIIESSDDFGVQNDGLLKAFDDIDD